MWYGSDIEGASIDRRQSPMTKRAISMPRVAVVWIQLVA
jgi:hypothetical protein